MTPKASPPSPTKTVKRPSKKKYTGLGLVNILYTEKNKRTIKNVTSDGLQISVGANIHDFDIEATRLRLRAKGVFFVMYFIRK